MTAFIILGVSLCELMLP